MQTLSPRLLHQRKAIRSLHYMPVAMAGFLFLFHLLLNLLDSYGIFRDEFYYLANAKRMDWGYVDHPPLSVFLLYLQTHLLGDSLAALRVLPALALSGTVFLTGLMVQRLRGGVIAVVLACVAVASAPIYLAMGSFYSMNSIDIFLWSAVAFILICICRKSTRKRWLVLGLVLGIGLLNKVGFLWLGAGLMVGMLITYHRWQFLTLTPYLSAAIALVLFLPFIIWNINHDFAHLEFMQNAVSQKYNGISRGDFIAGMVLQQNPVSILLWLPGLYFFLFSNAGWRFKLLGIIFVTVFSILLINGHSKSEYIAPAFPVIFAGGAVFLERKLTKARRSWMLFSLLGLLILSAALLSPLARPILPVESFVQYSQVIGISQKNSEGKEVEELPQFYADRFGWQELSSRVSSVYTSLPLSEQQHTLIFAQNYGEAGALEYYQQQYPLPPVISGHNAYWHWGVGVQPQVLIGIGGEKESYLKAFGEVTVVSIHQSRYAMPYEDNLPIFLCRKPIKPLAELWPHVKHYD